MRNANFLRLPAVLLMTAALLLAAAGAAQAAPASKSSASSAAATSTAVSTVSPSSTALKLSGLFELYGHKVTIPHRQVHMVTEIRPYVAKQRVTVQISVNGHEVRRFTTLLKHGPDDKYGWLSADAAAPKVGHVTVTVLHQGDSAMTGFAIHSYYFTLAERARYGSGSPFIQLMQQRLLARRIYIHQTGVFDEQTSRAVDAYTRLIGAGPGHSFSHRVVTDLLDGKGSFHVRYPDQGRHAEGDLTDQVLALINGKKVVWIYPISSGKETTPTVIGSWQIYLRTPGYLPDGMYYSDFFYRGYAIHGYDPSPDYPASHGCMRLWINDAIQVYNWLGLGDWVDSYGKPPFNLGLGYL